jgi:hypothetical protein
VELLSDSDMVRMPLGECTVLAASGLEHQLLFLSRNNTTNELFLNEFAVETSPRLAYQQGLSMRLDNPMVGYFVVAEEWEKRLLHKQGHLLYLVLCREKNLRFVLINL